MAKNNVDPYASFGQGEMGHAQQGGASGSLSMPHLVLTVIGLVLALASGLVKVTQGTGADQPVGFTAWGPVAGVVIGFAIVFFAGRKVKRFQS